MENSVPAVATTFRVGGYKCVARFYADGLSFNWTCGAPPKLSEKERQQFLELFGEFLAEVAKTRRRAHGVEA